MRITASNRNSYYNNQSNYPKTKEKVRVSQPDVVIVEDGRSPYGSGKPDNVDRAMKNLELAKKLAVLGMIFHTGLISEEEYSTTKNRIMMDYCVVSFLNN